MRTLILLLLLTVAGCKKEIVDLPAAMRCGTDQADESKYFSKVEGTVPFAFKTDTAEVINPFITIPVVFHVIWRTPAENIPDARIQEQIDILNMDFAGVNPDSVNVPAAFKSVKGKTRIQFCLAKRDEFNQPTTGIVRVNTTKTSYSANGAMKMPMHGGDTAWDCNKYMNIWVCNLMGCLGYANYPGGNPVADGIVLRYSVVGYNSTYWQYPYGKTAVHEAGHWLGIHHTFWYDCSDDFIHDTPLQYAANYNCPIFPKRDACNQTPNGVMYNNYMDNTYDPCLNMFTVGQCRKMDSILVTARKPICGSKGCRPIL